MTRYLLLILLGVVAGCATTEQQTVDPVTSLIDGDITSHLGGVEVSPNEALVYLYRPKRAMGSANVYRVTLNGKPVADLMAGTRFVTAVPAGPTTLQGESKANILNIGLALATMEKPNIVFEAEAQRAYFIDVKTGFAGGPEFVFVNATTGLEAGKNLEVAGAIQADEMANVVADTKQDEEGDDANTAPSAEWDSGDQLPDGQYVLILSAGIGHSVCSEHFTEGKQQAFSVVNGTIKQGRSPFIKVRSRDIKIYGDEFSGAFVGPFMIQSKAAMRFKGHRIENGFQGHYTASTGSLVCDGKFRLLRRAE